MLEKAAAEVEEYANARLTEAGQTEPSTTSKHLRYSTRDRSRKSGRRPMTKLVAQGGNRPNLTPPPKP